MTEPAIKHAIAFIDGQNVFHSAKEAYGHTFPNYDVNKLAAAVAEKHARGIASTKQIPNESHPFGI